MTTRTRVARAVEATRIQSGKRMLVGIRGRRSRCRARRRAVACHRYKAPTWAPNPVYGDASSTFDDVREAVTTLEDVERIARRVFGSTHPHLHFIERYLRNARAALRARETPSTSN